MAEYIDKKYLDRKFQIDMMCLWGGTIFDSRKIIDSLPTADVIERSTMEILCNEYLSKCNCCDECCAETYCILNSLRTENRDCVNNLITYFTKRNIGDSKEIE
jgi:hypothetical protein